MSFDTTPVYYSVLDMRQRLFETKVVSGNFFSRILPYLSWSWYIGFYLLLLTFYGERGTEYYLLKNLLINV